LPDSPAASGPGSVGRSSAPYGAHSAALIRALTRTDPALSARLGGESPAVSDPLAPAVLAPVSEPVSDPMPDAVSDEWSDGVSDGGVRAGHPARTGHRRTPTGVRRPPTR